MERRGPFLVFTVIIFLSSSNHNIVGTVTVSATATASAGSASGRPISIGGETGSTKPLVNGGYSCAVCTVLMSTSQQLAQVHNDTIVGSFERLCRYMPGKYREPCKIAADTLVYVFLYLVGEEFNPDRACHLLGFCYTEKGLPECRLFPKKDSKPLLEDHHKKVRLLVKEYFLIKHGITSLFPNICDLPGIKELCFLYENIFHSHFPGLDIDNDGHSTIETLRGTSWKGKDCDDLDASIHPGKRPIGSDVEKDANCNGIYGVNSEGHAYEDLFCKKSHQRGLIILGDSAAAHFHLPYQWFSPAVMDKEIFSHLSFVLENEGDWPMMSAYTGFRNITWPISPGPVHSFYHNMWKRNRCNHRDYQNIGVNGAQSFSVLKNQKRVTRNITTDHPVILMTSLIGNDVCNGYPDNETLDHMTTKKQMRENMQQLLEDLQAYLPAGSHVLLMGLGDGRSFTEAMLDRIHPLGQLNKDITYTQVYDYFNCLHVSPCTGWLNPKASIRDMTTKRAEELSSVIEDVAKKYHHHYQNFDIHFFKCPVNQVIKDWEAAHGRESLWQLVEPVDGFHPNQYSNALVADVIWQDMKKRLPHILGPVNPHNKHIHKVFGDQGGY